MDSLARISLLVAVGLADDRVESEASASYAGPLDYFECEGPGFDPAWVSFKRELTSRMSRGKQPGEALANQAANLLDAVEAGDFSLRVAAFAALLRGESWAAEALDGFCLYGAVSAYACIAMHLNDGAAEEGLPPTAKSSVARALLLLAKKQSNDWLESSSWPIRSLDLVALIEGEDADAVRALKHNFRLPCHFNLDCPATRSLAEEAISPPEAPLPVAWPEKVAAIGMHITSTLEVVTAFRDAVNEAWGRGGAGGAAFEVQYAGHPCPSHEGSEHQCAMKCEMLGQCGAGAEASDPLAEFLIGAVDVTRYQEKDVYQLSEARAALRWAPRRLAPLKEADMLLCTFPTVLCVLMHEMFPEKPMLFVAIANPLFAAPGCHATEDSTTRECQTDDAREYLVALRNMLSHPLVQGVAAYSVTAALVGYQAGIKLPLAGKAGRYLPATAFWRMSRPQDVLLSRSRFFDTAFGQNLRTLVSAFTEQLQMPLRFILQQEVSTYLSYEDLASFRGVVILPQDLGLHKFTEHYAMAMPIWMPAREWAYRLQMHIPWGMVSYSGSWRRVIVNAEESNEGMPGDADRLRAPSEEWEGEVQPDLTYPPWFNAQVVPYQLAKVAFWYEFSEFVAYPGVQAFDSVPALFEGASTTNLHEVSSTMRRYRSKLWQTTRAVYAGAASRLAARAAADLVGAGG